MAGWLILSGEGKIIPFFVFEVSPLMAPNPPLAEQVEAYHDAVLFRMRPALS